MDMLLHWVQAICESCDCMVDNFASMVVGRTMWCLLDYYFRSDNHLPCSSKISNGTSEMEGKHISYSNKNLAQTKKEQCWCFDPTIKYEVVRKCAVPRYAYHDDCPSDWTDSSDSEILTETMTEEEAQTQKEKILVEAKKEQPFSHDPHWNYDLLKQIFYLDYPDSLAYSNLILDSKTEEENKAKLDEYNSSRAPIAKVNSIVDISKGCG
ncbi:hypothetical protein POM88_016405 [Heracleum sosnowskyi]|uniref:Uncharacterized protein n=1 Tax=Heracleum sosnowskyi TaxID=360622 RepID=A0AAD8IPR8_9APIA|nr:hypothetical protein POM88_016405 [Heracleum sosnowskyi]